MLQFFDKIDASLFMLVNHGLQNPVFDFVMPIITNLHNNFPFKAFILPAILAFWFWKKRKQAVKVFLAMAITAGITDAISYRILKASFQRPRPNNNPAVESILRLPHSPQSYSMPSNHAVTSFALAKTLSFYYPGLTVVYFSIAAVVGFSRVYVGVHYLGDIIVGGLVGFFIALLLTRKIFSKIQFFKK